MRTLHWSLVAATMVMIVMGLVGMIIVTVVMVVEGVPGHLGLQVRANSHIPPRIQIMVRMIRLEQEEALNTTRIHRISASSTHSRFGYPKYPQPSPTAGHSHLTYHLCYPHPDRPYYNPYSTSPITGSFYSQMPIRLRWADAGRRRGAHGVDGQGLVGDVAGHHACRGLLRIIGAHLHRLNY